MRIWFCSHVTKFVCGHWLVDQCSDQEPLSPRMATGKSPADHWSITISFFFFLCCMVVIFLLLHLHWCVYFIIIIIIIIYNRPPVPSVLRQTPSTVTLAAHARRGCVRVVVNLCAQRLKASHSLVVISPRKDTDSSSSAERGIYLVTDHARLCSYVGVRAGLNRLLRIELRDFFLFVVRGRRAAHERLLTLESRTGYSQAFLFPRNVHARNNCAWADLHCLLYTCLGIV